jgi:hypothetical protein
VAVTDFVAELIALGHKDARIIAPGCVVWTWEVPTGPLIGRAVELGACVGEDYPDTPPRGPFVRPHLMPVNTQGGEHPHASVHPGSGHGFPDDSRQYWSRPFNGWARSSRDARAYLAFLRTLFDTLPADLRFPEAA